MSEIKLLGDSPTTKDSLGFDAYTEILKSAIENYGFEDSLTIGIHGGWGFGKTSLMKMLETHYMPHKTVTTIWFDAWAYGKNEPVGLALLRCVLTKVQKDCKLKEKSKDFIEKVGKLGIEYFLRNITMMSFNERKKLFEDNMDLKNSLREEFKDYIKTQLPKKRLIVFIDDLDRCLPEKVIEVLEVIKLYLDVPQCIFVIGVDHNIVEQAIEEKYKTDEINDKNEKKTLVCGKNYVNKIIQIPFVLPPVRVHDMAKFIDDLAIDENEKKYATNVAKGAGCNPRKVKMFLNILRLRSAIAEKTCKEIEYDVLAKLVVIEHTFPKFYEDIKKYLKQDFLCDMEKLAKGEANKELEEKLTKSEVMKRHNRDDDLSVLLKEEPYFCGTDLEPYIHLCGGKMPKESYVSDKSLFDDLYSGDWLKRDSAADAIAKMPDLDEQRYLGKILSDLKEGDKKG